MSSRLQLTSLTKVFPGGVRALDGIDVTIEPGEFFALLGPSGCGKTTLLRTIAGLETPTAGKIVLNDRDITEVPPGKRNLAMVFQDYALYPHMTVVDNVAYPLKVRKVPTQERRKTASEASSQLQLGELLERRPGQLSGGQQQRVALARAVAYRPDLFLFDEPLSNLDARLRLEARTFLKRLQKELGVTTIYVTHDQSEALALADRIAVMESGVIRQLATPSEVYQRPSSVFVSSFIGSTPMNMLNATVKDQGVVVNGVHLPIPESDRPRVAEGEEVVFAFRPEYAELHEDSDEARPGFVGTVAVVELLGIDNLVTVEHGDLSVQVTTRGGVRLGDRVRVVPETEHVLVYRRSDGRLVGSAGTPASTGGSNIDSEG